MIGNPPYGASLTPQEKQTYKKLYVTAQTIKGVQKGSTDTYTLFIELGYGLLHLGGCLTYIVPMSFTSSDALAGTHKLLKSNCETIVVSSYAVRPQPVFENAVVNTSIIRFVKTGTKCKQLLATKMHRKGHNFNLQALIDHLQFVDVRDLYINGRIPKIGTAIERSILVKLLSHRPVSDYITEKGSPIYYRFAGGRYYKIVTNYSTGSSAETYLSLKPEYADCIGCLLSSNLGFWFYQIFSDNLNWKSIEIESFPIPQINVDQIRQIGDIYKEYLTDIEMNANIRVSSGKSQYNVATFKEYKIVKSKPIIDRIDDLIGPFYGLTPEEIDFIKKYELEFRMSGDD